MSNRCHHQAITYWYIHGFRTLMIRKLLLIDIIYLAYDIVELALRLRTELGNLGSIIVPTGA